MSNRIDANLNALLNKTGQKVAQANNGSTNRTGGSGSAAGGSDQVVLTEQSQLLASLEKTVASMPAIDQARVDAVKADIEAGNYKIDLDSLAALLMQSDLQMSE